MSIAFFKLLVYTTYRFELSCLTGKLSIQHRIVKIVYFMSCNYSTNQLTIMFQLLVKARLQIALGRECCSVAFLLMMLHCFPIFIKNCKCFHEKTDSSVQD